MYIRIYISQGEKPIFSYSCEIGSLALSTRAKRGTRLFLYFSIFNLSSAGQSREPVRARGMEKRGIAARRGRRVRRI